MLLINWFRQEAVSVQGGLQALIGVGLAFGWLNWSSTQTGTVVALAAAMLAVITRRQVTPVARKTAPSDNAFATPAQA